MRSRVKSPYVKVEIVDVEVSADAVAAAAVGRSERDALAPLVPGGLARGRHGQRIALCRILRMHTSFIITRSANPKPNGHRAYTQRTPWGLYPSLQPSNSTNMHTSIKVKLIFKSIALLSLL